MANSLCLYRSIQKKKLIIPRIVSEVVIKDSLYQYIHVGIQLRNWSLQTHTVNLKSAVIENNEQRLVLLLE